jgi:hypothetical protein
MNFTTCLNLIKREYYEMRALLIWAVLAITIVLFFFALNAVNLDNSEQITLLAHGVTIAYIVSAVIIACLSFWEFKNPVDIRQYLLLPATALEKIIAKVAAYLLVCWLIFILCWIVALFFAVVLLSIISHANLAHLEQLVSSVLKINLFATPTVFLYQALALFASCYFRRLVFLKLSVSYILILRPLQSIFEYEANVLNNTLNANSLLLLLANASWLMLVTKMVAILILLALTWLRLKETEAH